MTRYAIQALLQLTLLVAFLCACQTTPEKEESTSYLDTQRSLSAEDVPKILAEADQGDPAEKAELQLLAIETLLDNNGPDWARNILTSMNAQTLDDSLYVRYLLAQSDLAIQEGSYFLAKRWLKDKRLQQITPQLQVTESIALHEKRAQLFFDLGEYGDSIRERLRLDDLLHNDAEQYELNQDLLWQTLMQIPTEQLQTLSTEASNSTLRGWYDLALLSKNNQSDLTLQLEQVDLWAMNWPEHPASLRLPADLQLLRQLIDEQAKQIALLLPFTGKLGNAAKAIRDGFMAAFYAANQRDGSPAPTVRFYDTATKDIITMYEQAVNDGADMMIGPLEREKIMELALLPELPVMTLALNYIDQLPFDVSHLFQFGLSVEDDAQQTASKAWRDGKRRALILSPKSTWGNRGAQAFQKQWEMLGGEIADIKTFTSQKEYSKIIMSALHVDQSKDRRRHIRRLTSEPIEFEPRRRQDMDMIFLVANPNQARQLKPTLAFHYASKLPVYSTSYVYNGLEDKERDKDINGIRFATLPWFFANNVLEKSAIDAYAKPQASYLRLYALGVDSFHLYPRLKQLQQVTQAQLYGQTGTLQLNESGRIERQPTWAHMVNGKAVLMPTSFEH